MTSRHSDGHVRVRRLRMTYGDRDVLAARLAVGRLLSSVDLRPAGMPPAAVLIVRRLADPLPGRLAPHRRSVRVDAAWERAARDALAALYRRAARPDRGYVPASAEAVLFADEGEMLAYLALDVARGKAQQRWWWRAILDGVPSPLPAGLTRLMCERAASVPAALHHLVVWRQAVPVLDVLSPSQAMAILSAVVRAFDVPDLHPDSTLLGGTVMLDAGSTGGERSPAQAWGGEVSLSVGMPGARHGVFPARAPPPWDAGLVSTVLEKRRACLLGVSLSLYRRPAAVRGESFWAALAAWWEEAASWPDLRAEPVEAHRGAQDQELGATAQDEIVEAASPRTAGEGPLPGFPPPRAEEAQVAPAGRRRVGRALQQRPAERCAGETERSAVAESRPADKSAGQMVEDDARLAQGPSSCRLPEGSVGTDERPTKAATGLGRDEQPARLIGQPEWKKSDAPVAEAFVGFKGGLYTELGGVLYLVNLMAYLDLPACFEDDWWFESQVGSWGVLELLGRGLLAWEDRAARRHAGDVLWAVLARLDGREPGELPGATFLGGERFRLPGDWFAGIDGGEGGYHYAARRGRLRLWSGDGYVLAELPRDKASPKAQAAAVSRRYPVPVTPGLVRAAFDRAPLAHLDGPLVAGLNPHLARWLALVLPAVRLRLRRALTPSGDGVWNLAETLLLCPGQLYVTSTHVDLVMSMDSISLPVRLAGLDRNPGWMADLGRVVSFHFE